MRIGILVGLVAAPVLVLQTLHAIEQRTELDPLLRLDQAELLVDYSNVPPVAGTWQPVDLPTHKATPHSSYASAWYRLAVNVDKPAERRWAFYAPVVLGNIEVFINGTSIGNGGAMEPPLADHRTPLMFEFSAQLLNTGPNIVDIHFVRPHQSVALSPVYLGPVTSLLPAATSVHAFRFWLPLTILIAMLVVALIIGPLAVLRSQEPAYAWYAIALLCWSVHQGHELVTQIPFDYWLWLSISYYSLGLFVFSAFVFTNRFMGLRAPRIERIFAIWLLPGFIPLGGLAYFDGAGLMHFSRLLWTPSILVLGGLLLVQMVRGVMAKPNMERIVLMVVANVVLVIGIRDYLWEQGGGSQESTYYLQYCAGLVLISFSFILMYRFSRALQDAETLSVELESRVQEKHRQLQENFETLKRVESERALATERARIMRDVHDGLGGHLLQILSQVEEDPALQHLEPDIRAALQDLRLIVDSLTPNDGNLLTVLGSFRHRAQKLVEQNGLRFDWQVQELPDIPNLGPERVLNVLRIFQEAVANIIHHAGAKTITVATHLESEHISLSISDDGCGFDVHTSTGQGLANLRRRAQELGATLNLTSSINGTTVHLLLPIRIT